MLEICSAANENLYLDSRAERVNTSILVHNGNLFYINKVVLISYDYKKSLWGVDPNSVEYSQVKSQVS